METLQELGAALARERTPRGALAEHGQRGSPFPMNWKCHYSSQIPFGPIQTICGPGYDEARLENRSEVETMIEDVQLLSL